MTKQMGRKWLFIMLLPKSNCAAMIPLSNHPAICPFQVLNRSVFRDRTHYAAIYWIY